MLYSIAKSTKIFALDSSNTLLNAAVRKLGPSSISTFDILVKSGHMRMVYEENEWRLHNSGKKDIALLEKMGFIPEKVLSLY